MQTSITIITRTTPKKDRGFKQPNQGKSTGAIKRDGYEDILEVFDTLLEVELIELDPAELDAIENCNGNEKLLTMLLHSVEDEEYLMHITFNELIKLPYFRAYAAIQKFPMIKRIEMLQQLDVARLYAYERLGQDETGLPREEKLTTKQRNSLYGRIKHLEILLGWLYGIDTVDKENEKQWVTQKR